MAVGWAITDAAECQPRIGSYVVPDGHGLGECLAAGDSFSDAGYPGCAFRYPAPRGGPIPSVACNVTVTGRTYQWRSGDRWVRVRIEWVGDCEPSTYSSGWMLVK